MYLYIYIYVHIYFYKCLEMYGNLCIYYINNLFACFKYMDCVCGFLSCPDSEHIYGTLSFMSCLPQKCRNIHFIDS